MVLKLYMEAEFHPQPWTDVSVPESPRHSLRQDAW